MFWKKNSARDGIAPNSPSAVRFGIIATKSYQELVLVPSEPASLEFSHRVESLSRLAEVVADDPSKLEEAANSLEASVRSFSNQQRRTIEKSIEDVYTEMRTILGSLDGAMGTGDELQSSTEKSQERLHQLERAPDFESVVSGLKKEVQTLHLAIQKHRDNSKVIRQVCAQQVDDLRSKLNTAEKAVHSDHLTKLGSRAAFDFVVHASIAKADHGDTFSLAMVDLDDFKQINDKYGHLCGDAALIEFSKRLQAFFGNGGSHVARLGGDEFAVIMKAPALQLEVRLEKMLSTFDQNPLSYQGKRVMVTASYGVVQLRRNHTMESALHEADVKMYEAKHSNRKSA